MWNTGKNQYFDTASSDSGIECGSRTADSETIAVTGYAPNRPHKAIRATHSPNVQHTPESDAQLSGVLGILASSFMTAAGNY